MSCICAYLTFFSLPSGADVPLLPWPCGCPLGRPRPLCSLPPTFGISHNVPVLSIKTAVITAVTIFASSPNSSSSVFHPWLIIFFITHIFVSFYSLFLISFNFLISSPQNLCSMYSLILDILYRNSFGISWIHALHGATPAAAQQRKNSCSGSSSRLSWVLAHYSRAWTKSTRAVCSDGPQTSWMTQPTQDTFCAPVSLVTGS